LIATTTGVGTVQWLKYKVEVLPIPKLSPMQQTPITDMVEQLIAGKKRNDDVTALECALDSMIYHLFGFSDEERAIIDDRS
jgi:hypothetical protein